MDYRRESADYLILARRLLFRRVRTNAERRRSEMKKITIMLTTFAILLCWITSVYAAEVLGYPIVPKQAKFYIIILGVIGASVAMVSSAYFFFWLADLKKKRKVTVLKPSLSKGREAFGGRFAPQPAK